MIDLRQHIFTKDDVVSCWKYHLEYLTEILNGEYDLDTAREDLLSLIGTKWDDRT